MAKLPQNKQAIDTSYSGNIVVHKNTDQEIIVVPEDRLRLCLYTHRDALESKKAWLAPLGILISLVTTLISSDFKDRIFSPAIWSAIFIIASGLSTIWLVRDLVRLVRRWSDRDLDLVINNLKNQNPNP